MPHYEVYATRYDSAGIVEELVPARGLEFSLPLSDHGECTFTATVESGRSLWRAALALPFSGILVARDGVPVWSGLTIAEQQTGPRSFGFTAREWGWVFEEKIAITAARTWTRTNDHQMMRDLVTQAQAVARQNFLIEVGDTLGAQVSDRTVNAWDKTTVGREWRSIGDADGGPEWYTNTAGTLETPRRILVQGDRLGHVDPVAVLEYVEDTLPVDPLRPLPTVTLLGNLYPGPAPVVPVRRAGGNVIALSRSRSLANAATVVIATGSGEEAAQLRSTATASTLLAQGWPRLTAFSDYRDVTVQSTLNRRAQADLKDMAGIATGYSLVTLEDDPTADWTQTPRGSSVRVVLDTDVYGGDRPVGGADGFVARCIDMAVRVPDSGSAQVEWRIEDRLEVA